MKKNIVVSMLVMMAVFSVNIKSFAQQTKHISSEDSAAFNALVLYPDTIRLDIFEVCQYPAAIVNMASLQTKSSSGFSDAISNYSKDEKEDFWNLSRYSDLITVLVQGGKKSKEEIDRILINYPEDIHETAIKFGTQYYETLKKIDDLQTQINNQFAQILSDYPSVTQDALKELTQFPEIIILLNDHLSLSVRIGDHYKRDPKGVIHRMDSLNLAAVRQNAEDAAAWKQNIEQNPDEASDLKNASTDFATDNGYTQDEINTVPSSYYVSNYYCNPYSYWFGYPTWYPYSYWYPYPFWFDCGFYYDAFGNLIIIGYPSYYFTNWYFYYPEHMHHYPHLCDSYINHYYGGHHRQADANSVIVHNWVRDNQNYLPKDFLTNKSNRVEVIKQIGQLNEDVQKTLNGKKITTTIKDQYFQNNTTKYPALNSTQQTKTWGEVKLQNTPENLQTITKQPPVKITNTVQKTIVTPKQNNTEPTYDFNKINNAQEYHKQTWEQTQPSGQQQQQQKQQPQQQQQQQQQQQKQQPQQQQQQQQKQQPQQQQQPVKQTPTQQKPNNQTSSGKKK